MGQRAVRATAMTAVLLSAVAVTLVATPTDPVAAASGHIFPLDCRYQWYHSTYAGHGVYDDGRAIDLNMAGSSADRGKSVHATASGTVRYVNGGNGEVSIQHGQSRSLYAHMQDISVNAGQSVAQGQKIGEVGGVGVGGASHLHYEQHQANGGSRRILFGGRAIQYVYTSPNGPRIPDWWCGGSDPDPPDPPEPTLSNSGYDFNGDGAQDILWHVPGAPVDRVWWGRRAETTFTTTVHTVGGDYVPLAGDYTGNGADDIYWFARGSADDNMWLGDEGQRGFNHGGTPWQAEGIGRLPFTGDFDADGHDDIFWYGPGSISDSVWFGKRAAPYFDIRTVAVNGTYVPVPGDFNGDSATDVLWYAPGRAEDKRWNGRPGSRGFNENAKGHNKNGTYQPAVGDFDGNGIDDVFWHAPFGGDDHISWGRSGADLLVTMDANVNGSYWPIAVDATGNGATDIYWYGPGSMPDSFWLGNTDGRDRFVAGVAAPSVDQLRRPVRSTYLAVRPDPFASWDAFVARQLLDLIGTPVTANWRAPAAHSLALSMTHPTHFTIRLMRSDLFDGVVAPVARLYRAFFLRQPDHAGLEYWVDQRRQGRSLFSVARYFGVSPEFRSRYGTLDDAAFVRLVYRNVLGRSASQTDINFWVGQIWSGWSRGRVMVGFSESPEHRSQMAATIDVMLAYTGLLDRQPTDAELAAGRSMGIANLVERIRYSAEYVSRVD